MPERLGPGRAICGHECTRGICPGRTCFNAITRGGSVMQDVLAAMNWEAEGPTETNVAADAADCPTVAEVIRQD